MPGLIELLSTGWQLARRLASWPLVVTAVVAYGIWFGALSTPGPIWAPFVVSTLLNPALLGAVALLLAHRRFHRAVMATAGSRDDSPEALDSLGRSIELVTVVRETVENVGILKSGLSIAYLLDKELRGAAAARRGLNSDGSAENAVRRPRRLAAEQVFDAIGDFVIAGADGNRELQVSIVSALSSTDAHVEQVLRLVDAAMNDGGPDGQVLGYLSSLNGLYLLALYRGLPIAKQEEVDSALSVLGIDAQDLGWLGLRFLQAALVKTIRDHADADEIIRTLSTQVAAAGEGVRERQDYEDRTAFKWDLRNPLRHDLGHFVAPARLARALRLDVNGGS